MTEFRFATADDADALRALWSYSFEKPGDPFFDWYFGARFRPETVLLGTVDDAVSCALHLRPVTLSVRQKKFPVRYIVGVTTHPAARGHGHARELLRAALRRSRDDGCALDILMPSSAPLYRHIGFGFYAHLWEREAAPQDLASLAEPPHRAMTPADSSVWSILAAIYDAFTKNKNGFPLRSESAWRSLLEEILLESRIAVVYDKDGPAGYLFYQIEGNRLIVSEFVCASESGRRMLYGYLTAHAGQVETCRWYEPLGDKSFLYFANGAEHTFIQNRTFPFMMARLADPASAFTGLPAPKDLCGHISFTLTDPFLPEISGNYSLSADAGAMHVAKQETKAAADFTIDAEGAAQLLFGTLTPQELARYEKITSATEETLRFLAALFPKEDNWIHDWY